MEYHTCAPICPERCNTKSDTYCLSRETLTIEGHIYSTGSEHEFSGCSSGCVCQPDYIMSDQGNFCIQAEDCDKDHFFEPADLRLDPSIETPCNTDPDENLVWDDCGAHCIDTCANYDIVNNKLGAHPCSKICSPGCRCKDGMVVFEGKCRRPNEVCGNFNTCDAKGAKYSSCLLSNQGEGNGNSCGMFLSSAIEGVENSTINADTGAQNCQPGCFCPQGTTWLFPDKNNPNNKCVPTMSCGYCQQLTNKNCDNKNIAFNSYKISNSYSEDNTFTSYNTILPRFFNFDLSIVKNYYEDVNDDPLDLGIVSEQNERLESILVSFAESISKTKCVKSLNAIYEFKTVDELLAVTEEIFMEQFLKLDECSDILKTYEDELINHKDEVEPHYFDELISGERASSQVPGDCECPSRRTIYRANSGTVTEDSYEDAESASSTFKNLLSPFTFSVVIFVWLAV